MLTKLTTINFHRLEPFPQTVYASRFPGMSEITILGLAGARQQQLARRLYAIIKNSGYKYPADRKIIDIGVIQHPWSTNYMDLGLIIGLIALNKEYLPHNLDWQNYCLFGALSPTGELLHTGGERIIVREMIKLNRPTTIFLNPEVDLRDLDLSQLKIVYANNLNNVISHLTNPRTKPLSVLPSTKELQTDSTSLQKTIEPIELISGQIKAKRGITIALAGGHNLALIGPPGVGKTKLMLATMRLEPPESADELAYTKLLSFLSDQYEYAKTGRIQELIAKNSTTKLIGNSSTIGQLDFLVNGFGLIDELTLWPKEKLEQLKQKTNINLIATLNPCPCGNLGSRTRSCECNNQQLTAYQNRFSLSLKDRFPLKIHMQPADNINNHDLIDPKLTENKIRELISIARTRQRKRQHNKLNGQLELPELNKLTKISPAAEQLVNRIATSYKLSNRAELNLYRISLTIADLAQKEEIGEVEILEALEYTNWLCALDIF